MNDKQREKLIEKYRDINVDTDWWSDEIVADWVNEMEAKGITVNKDRVYWGHLGWGGLGQASFAGVLWWCDWPTAVAAHPDWLTGLDAVKTYFELDGVLYTKIDDLSDNIPYAHNVRADVEREWDLWDLMGNPDAKDNPLAFRVYEHLDNTLTVQIGTLQERIQESMQGAARDLYTRLEETYEDLTSDDAVWGTIEANGLDEDEDEDDTDWEDAA